MVCGRWRRTEPTPPEGWSDVDETEGVSRQLLLAHCRFPVAAIAKPAREFDGSGHSRPRCPGSRTRPSEASYAAAIWRDVQLGPSLRFWAAENEDVSRIVASVDGRRIARIAKLLAEGASGRSIGPPSCIRLLSWILATHPYRP
jgi:hypothetical protein